MSTQTYDPLSWFITGQRALQAYVKAKVDTEFLIQFEYPNTDKMTRDAPFKHTIIHFESDNIVNPWLGLGPQYRGEVINVAEGTISMQEANVHMVDWDVGVWASEASGGATSRMVAMEKLTKAFCGPGARRACMNYTGGVEIMSFVGGRTFTDGINDLPVWRTSDMTLRVRLFSKELVAPEFLIQTVLQDPGIEVDETIVVDP